MAAQGTAVKSANIDNVFATTQDEIYANNPFYGAIFRIGNGQETYLRYVKKKERLTLSKFLDQKDISQGQFLIKMNGENGRLKEIPIMVNKNADSSAANPFFQNMPQAAGAQSGGMSKALKDEYEKQILNLRGKISGLTDELVKAKRELGDDKTETVLSHEKELNRLKETYRDEKEELKDQLTEKKHEIKFLELEMRQKNGGQNGWDKVLDKFLNDDFLSNIAAQVGRMMQQQGNAQPTPQQIQAAARQQMQAQAPAQNGTQNDSPRTNPESDNQESASATESTPKPHQHPQQLTPEQVKKQFVEGLKNAAIEALTANNAKLNEYAHAVRSQMALLKQQGVTIDAAQWVQLAKILGQQAVEKEITADRVAVVLNPLLENLPTTAKVALKTISPKAAADMLFNMYSVEVNPTVKSMVVKVLTVLKKLNN